jgi:adenosylcobinamide-GDP ribazoletransferase
MRELLADLAAALGLLTCLPTGWLPQHGAEAGFGRSIWAYPLVGLGLGLAGGALFSAGLWLGLPPAVAALCALGAGLLLGGGFHEDGLADTADGFGGGRGAARKLEIMRDSRIGAFGVLALLVVLGLRVAALASLPGGWRAVAAAGAAGALGRGVILLLLLRLPPARRDGLAAGLAQPAAGPLTVGLAFALLPALLLLPFRAALPAILAAALCGLLLARLARRQIGGQTGDVLGAGAALGECAVLVVLCSALLAAG